MHFLVCNTFIAFTALQPQLILPVHEFFMAIKFHPCSAEMFGSEKGKLNHMPSVSVI